MVLVFMSGTVAWGAGTCTVSQHSSDVQGWRTLTFTWVGDASDGTVPATTISADDLAFIKGWLLCGMETDPSDNVTLRPTDNYDITLMSGGRDLAGAELANRDTANTEFVVPKISTTTAIWGCVPVWSAFTYTTANQSVVRATGVTRLYFYKAN
jgi:hypothetical protein